MPEISLTGCKNKPLSGALKSLGVFRVVATQADPSAAGFWQDDHFLLDTVLTREDLATFFCDSYRPTPIMNPWNGGSGFWPNDNKKAMNSILETKDPRFSRYADAIRTVQGWPAFDTGIRSVADVLRALQLSMENLSGRDLHDRGKMLDDLHHAADACGEPLESLTEERMKDIPGGPGSRLRRDFSKARNAIAGTLRSSGKDHLLLQCRASLPEDALLWLDAAIAMDAEGNPSYNPVLGQGGNDGRNDFSKNYMEAVTKLLLGKREKRHALLLGSLFQECTQGCDQKNIGLFDPGRAGGYNQWAGPGIGSGIRPSPWDFVLTLEGATFLASAVTKRSQADSTGIAITPFTVSLSAFGYTSSVTGEKGKAELWFPIWHHPATLDEIAYLFAEGRGSLGRRPARTGTEFIRALGQLGVERGIHRFVRYAFIPDRRGKSNVAMPVGEHAVRYRPLLALLNELDPILYRLSNAATVKALASPLEQIQEEVFRCSVDPTETAFTRIVRALGRFNRVASRIKKPTGFPQATIGLPTDWISACRQTPELRIAASVASIHGGPCFIASNLLNTRRDKPMEWCSDGASDWRGPDVYARMGSVLSRRLLDMEKEKSTGIPLVSHLRAWPEDAAMLVYGGLNLAMIEELLFGFLFTDWRKRGQDTFRVPERTGVTIPRAYALLKLCFTPDLHRAGFGNPRELVCLLQGNRTKEALERAGKALRIRGWIPHDAAFPGDESGKALIAALLVPVRDEDRLRKMVIKDIRDQEVV